MSLGGLCVIGGVAILTIKKTMGMGANIVIRFFYILFAWDRQSQQLNILYGFFPSILDCKHLTLFSWSVVQPAVSASLRLPYN